VAHERLAAALILLAIVSSVLALYADASREIGCVNAYFLAYNNETKTGSVVPARICVFSSSRPSVAIVGVRYNPSVLDSFLVALHTISRFCTPRANHVRVVVYFNGGNLYVEGASGSLLFALSVLKILNATRIMNVSSATGVLSIDGFIDPVGAVREKLAAAYRRHIATVLVPLLNYVMARNASPKPKVVYVDTILDVCKKRYRAPLASPATMNVNRTIVSKMYSVLRDDVYRFTRLANSTLAKLPPKARASLTKTFETYLRIIRRLVKENHIYSAASQSFGLYITVANASLSYTNLTYLSRLVDEAVNIVNNVYEKLERSKSISVNAIPFVLVLLNRIKDTVFYANVFRNITVTLPPKAIRVSRLASIVSYTYGRGLTSQTWFKLFTIANSSGGPYLPSRIVLRASWKVLNLVSGMIELGRAYSPLSLDTIASTRGYLAALSGNSSLERKVFNDIRELLTINLENLTPVQRIIPYFYTLYSNDLRKLRNVSIDTQIMFYSLSDLIASATINTEEAIRAVSAPQRTWSPPNSLVYGAIYASSIISAGAMIVALLLLKVIEKRLRAASA